MRNLRFELALRRWLRQEGAGSEQRAEAALTNVFRRLPPDEPSAAFLANVLIGAGFAPPARLVRDLRGLRWRAPIAVSGVLAAAALAYLLPAVVAGVGALVRTGKPVELAAAALAGVIERVGEGLFLFEAISRIGGIVAGAVASPGVLAILSLCSLVSLIAFRLLEGILVSDRSGYYAQL